MNSPTIGILAGEASGDNLGAGLMREFKLLHPNCAFVGIGGPRMIAEGLESAHEKRVVHRDIKPANVMVDAKGLAEKLGEGGIGDGTAAPK